MTVTPDELRAALEYVAGIPYDYMEETTREAAETHSTTLAAAYRREKALREEAIEALQAVEKHATEYLGLIEQFSMLSDADYEMTGLGNTDAELCTAVSKARAVLAKAKEAGAAVYGGDAAMDAIRAEERERIAQMVCETWFKKLSDDQESPKYRRGIREGIRRVADAIRRMK